MKIFAVSDIHGFYDEMKVALDKAGFEPNNSNHLLVGCGDYFDRGPKNLEVLQYLSTIKNKVLIRGNHEDLLVDCCYRKEAYYHDERNGTADTIKEIGRAAGSYSFAQCCDRALARISLFLDSMVDYFETENYIFVHSFIPLTCKDNKPFHYINDREFEFNPEWRSANERDWEQARWGDPYDLIDKGFLPNKILVFGHWHCSAGWAKALNRSEFGEEAVFSPFYGNGFISIDACTAYTKKVNVVVIEDNLIKE